MNQKQGELCRLKNILIIDKASNPTRLAEVLKTDIIKAINQYLCVDPPTCNVDVRNLGESFDIQISMKACKIF